MPCRLVKDQILHNHSPQKANLYKTQTTHEMILAQEGMRRVRLGMKNVKHTTLGISYGLAHRARVIEHLILILRVDHLSRNSRQLRRRSLHDGLEERLHASS